MMCPSGSVNKQDILYITNLQSGKIITFSFYEFIEYWLGLKIIAAPVTGIHSNGISSSNCPRSSWDAMHVSKHHMNSLISMFVIHGKRKESDYELFNRNPECLLYIKYNTNKTRG